MNREGMSGRPAVRLIIPGTLPNLNDYITAERQHRQKAAAMKRQAEQVVLLAARKLRDAKPSGPVVMRYAWYEPNKRRDKDNISSFGRKVIQDALVRAGVLRNDGWADIDGFSDEFYIDKKRPRIEVEIYGRDICAGPAAGDGADRGSGAAAEQEQR